MAKLLKLRRGTTTQHNSFTGAEGEVTVDTTKDTLVVHDNSTAGGRAMLREDLDNMPASGVSAGTYGSSSAIPSITVDAKGRVTGATTTAIDSTTITNGTSNVSVANSGEVTVVRAGSTKLVTKSDGVDVTGELQCDTLDVDGAADISGNLAVGGTVDGRDVAADGTKLDGIESGATGDQTAAEVRALVESASDSNVFTDADHSKLNGIESGATADQTAAEIRTLVESASDSNVFTDADHTKLNGIESNATADQTASEILTAIKTVDGSGSGLDADLLDGHSSGSYLRSDAADTASSDITFSGGAGAVTLAANSDIRATTGTWTGEAGSNTGKIQYHSNTWYFQSQGGWIFRDGSGNSRVSIDNSGNLTAQGNVTAYSDIRLKKDIEVIPNALDKVLNMRGVNYTDIELGDRRTGVIAQELQKVMPEAVREREEYLAVAYGNLVGVLIESIKELEARVRELEGE
jgi:hypothetical protein